MNILTVKKNRLRTFGPPCISAILFAGCAHETPVVHIHESVSVAKRPLLSPTPIDKHASVHVSEEFRMACNLPDEPQDAPHFGYDQSSLDRRGENILDEVATCLTDGPLRGRIISIIGRADPRGSKKYNRELGIVRAEAARNYLVFSGGVPTGKMYVLSRGEQGATGSDEASWELDRRVDLELGISVLQ
jgi:outer membrane protein OmpA-like peptidoglycan-associated protein